MFSMKTWMLGAAVLAGDWAWNGAGEGRRVWYLCGGPAAYVPPCPGPGYAWVAGYYADGYWVPGRWNFVGVRGPVVRYGYDRDFYRRDFDRIETGIGDGTRPL